MNNQISYIVDQLMLEQGEYTPLDLLLQEGRLYYDDYEAWRNGDIDYLDTVLFGDNEQITELLMQAENYIKRLGLQAEPINYHSWRQDQPQTLHFSENPDLERCFHLHFHKPKDQPQMDLFMDAPANSLVNGIQAAILHRNEAEARRQLERLYDTAPDHAKLPDLEQLVDALELASTPVKDISTEMQMLQHQLTPLAETLLGKDSHNLLILLWRRLSTALQGKPYQPTAPNLHESYTAIQAMDWCSARQAVEQVPNWQNDLDLLLRHAHACSRLQLNQEALISWCLLCWQFPNAVTQQSPSFSAELNTYWQDFLDLEPALPPQDFPSWLLLRNPGLVTLLPTQHPAKKQHTLLPCTDSYMTLHDLQTEKRNTPQANDDIKKRAQLKQQNFPLFQHFLNRIDIAPR